MTEHVRFDGRILFLSCDPQVIAAQLAGEEVSLEAALPLRDDVSTDEITPVTTMLSYDERLGRYPYVGLQVGGRRPVGEGAIKAGGFAVTVAGKRYGKGSSRESSPLAERAAGIRLIIAESFERIYQQNCDNIGILTSTDFALIARIAAGEPIPMAAFLEGRDEITRQIILAGGLMAFSRTRDWPVAAPVPAAQGGAPQTLVEKILLRHAHPETARIEAGAGIFVAADWRFSHDYFTGMAAHAMDQGFGPAATVRDPERVAVFNDHLVLAPLSVPHRRDGLLPGIADLVRAHEAFASRHPVRAHGALPDASGAEGICHAMMAERYVLPGEVAVGTDSHTPHSGALGALAFGAGATDIAHAWVTGYIRCTVPQTLRIEITGRLQPGVTAKDVVLHLLRQPDIRKGEAIGAVFEFGGSAVRAMSVDERATLTNMTAELGGFTGIVEPDAATVAFLRERRGVAFELEPWMASDPGASYRRVITLDAGAIPTLVARPGDPGNGVAIAALEAPVSVDIAYGGSCTAGKRADFDFYHEVLRWGVDHGLRVADGVRLYLQFGTLDVRQYCEGRGYLETFRQAGAELVMPGCGACANCGPGQSTAPGQVTISAINRNFPGRSGPGEVWLANPFTVAASALAGRIVSFADLQSQMPRGR